MEHAYHHHHHRGPLASTFIFYLHHLLDQFSSCTSLACLISTTTMMTSSVSLNSFTDQSRGIIIPAKNRSPSCSSNLTNMNKLSSPPPIRSTNAKSTDCNGNTQNVTPTMSVVVEKNGKTPPQQHDIHLQSTTPRNHGRQIDTTVRSVTTRPRPLEQVEQVEQHGILENMDIVEDNVNVGFSTPKRRRIALEMPPLRQRNRFLSVQWDEDMHETRRSLEF